MLDTLSHSLMTLSQLYEYLDSLFEQEVDSDTLFASGYMRGIIASAATNSGDEQQALTSELVQIINEKITATKAELSPQDSVIVSNFWLDLQRKINI